MPRLELGPGAEAGGEGPIASLGIVNLLHRPWPWRTGPREASEDPRRANGSAGEHRPVGRGLGLEVLEVLEGGDVAVADDGDRRTGLGLADGGPRRWIVAALPGVPSVDDEVVERLVGLVNHREVDALVLL